MRCLRNGFFFFFLEKVNFWKGKYPGANAPICRETRKKQKNFTMQLQCPHCRKDILAEDVNIGQLIAKCRHCDHVFAFEKQVRQAPRQRPEVVMPSGIEAYSLLSELNIEVSWRSGVSSFLTFFTILWNALVLPFVLVAIANGELMMLAGISLHLLVGVSLIYYTLAMLLNTTYILVNHHRLTIEHKPLRLPFYPNRDLSVAEIDQAYVEKYVASRTNGRPDWAHAVVAALKDGEHMKLVKGLKNPRQALYIEQEIERFLDIEDRPVEGEWAGAGV